MADQFGVATRLRLKEADQIGVPTRPQIRTLGVGRTDHDHQAGEGTYRRRERTSKWPAAPVSSALSVAGSAQDRDNRAPSVGGSASGQVWVLLDRVGIHACGNIGRAASL